MKFVVLGDTHFGMRSESQIFHDLYKRFYHETLFKYMEDNGINVIVQLGDLFDRRKYINFQTLALAKEYFFDELVKRGITLYTLIGNHDSYYKNTLSVNSIELLLGGYSNIHIHSKPSKIELDGLSFDMIPWICDENLEPCIDFIKASNSEFCFGHFELAGFEMDRGTFCHEGLDANNLSKYELVMTGHFHHRSTRGNILYVGSPGEMTWADYDDPRGFHVFDTETREVEFIQNPFTIFHKHTYDDEDFYYDDLKIFDFTQFENKYVKVIVANKNNPYVFESFIERLLKANPADVSIVENFVEQSAEEEKEEEKKNEVDQADDTMTILDRFIDGIDIELNKAKLKGIIRSVYNDALNSDGIDNA